MAVPEFKTHRSSGRVASELAVERFENGARDTTSFLLTEGFLLRIID